MCILNDIFYINLTVNMKRQLDKKKQKIVIKKPLPKDAQGVQELLYHTWLATYPNEEFGITVDDIEDRFNDRKWEEALVKRKKYISDPPIGDAMLVAKEVHRIVGLCRVIRHEDKNELLAIYVLPEHQGRGVGKLLWQQAKKCFDSGKNTIVQVATYNKKAIRFYEKIGFCDTGKRWSDEKFKMKSGAVLPLMEMIVKAQNE